VETGSQFLLLDPAETGHHADFAGVDLRPTKTGKDQRNAGQS
jgi:hypothetical protein